MFAAPLRGASAAAPRIASAAFALAGRARATGGCAFAGFAGTTGASVFVRFARATGARAFARFTGATTFFRFTGVALGRVVDAGRARGRLVPASLRGVALPRAFAIRRLYHSANDGLHALVHGARRLTARRENISRKAPPTAPRVAFSKGSSRRRPRASTRDRSLLRRAVPDLRKRTQLPLLILASVRDVAVSPVPPVRAMRSPKSPEYMIHAIPICRRFTTLWEWPSRLKESI